MQKLLTTYYDIPYFVQDYADIDIKVIRNMDDIRKLDAQDYVPDYVYFGGGHDVSPFLYGEKQHKLTACDTFRDFLEVALYNRYKTNPDTLYFGICRGSQFLNVMCGGSLNQHLADIDSQHHPKHHVKIFAINTKLAYKLNKEIFKVNSTHHQSVRMLGAGLQTTLVDTLYGIIEGFESHFGDKIRAVQSHPEYLDEEYDMSEVVIKYLLRIGE